MNFGFRFHCVIQCERKYCLREVEGKRRKMACADCGYFCLIFIVNFFFMHIHSSRLDTYTPRPTIFEA